MSSYGYATAVKARLMMDERDRDEAAELAENEFLDLMQPITTLDLERADHDALAAEWHMALANGYYGETGVRRF